MSRALRLAQRAKAIFEQADLEGRELTGEERSYAQGLLDEAQEVAGYEKRITDIGRQLGPVGDALTDPRRDHGGAGPGDVFVDPRGSSRSAIQPPAVSNGPRA